MQHAFTVDVEDYFQVSALARVVERNAWSTFPSRVVPNTHRVLDLLDKHETKATCFILGWIADRYPELVKTIANRGHEIACHGYSHQLIFDQSPSEFRDETRRAKDILEQITGTAVRGYRAASYSITKQSLWALDVLIELGFSYDSSIFPVRHDRYGIPAAPRFPHVIERGPNRTIIEFPISTLAIRGIHLPVGGGGYFRIFPYWLSAGALSRLDRVEHQPAIFYIHPWEVDPDQPRIKASLLSRFRHYHNLHKCEQRLSKLLTKLSFNTAALVLENYPHPLKRVRYEEIGDKVVISPAS